MKLFLNSLISFGYINSIPPERKEPEVPEKHLIISFILSYICSPKNPPTIEPTIDPTKVPTGPNIVPNLAPTIPPAIIPPKEPDIFFPALYILSPLLESEL